MVAKRLLQWITWPTLVLGFGAGAIVLVEAGAGLPALLALLAGAILFSFLTERWIPYQPDWNRPRRDIGRDWAHALVNLSLNRASVWLLPAFAWLAVTPGIWPDHWAFWAQVVMAVLILDLGIAAAHHASHRFYGLWRFHAVHHSIQRLYGFNGLMKHPLHQGVEMLSGVLPLLLLGIPLEVALTLPFLVSLALLGQHSNADIRTGGLKYLFANAEIHRFHHSNGANGDVNYGLLTTLYDHVMGTFHYAPGTAPRSSQEIGVRGRPDYPATYREQLLEPFRRDHQGS
ncbi:sterol desaturase family protein [Alcanivorax sp. JB21]|uniref:sterol desaturase family protein n=1 Tax=Alcanivorax limicola TaxID=2874102 RepID=UPI001CBA962A|nr:sterol desaturase family protein [Alcanivorax limicola]MBZ2190011.1 sterol desaturase family protein [Alcanivorax limicola]